MNEQEIQPSKITKPIQLLSAWLVGLIVINGLFLGTATILNTGFLQDILVIASVFNVPIFIVAIFLLQTRFRPEMQEDKYYSHYLDRKTNQVVRVSKEDLILQRTSYLDLNFQSDLKLNLMVKYDVCSVNILINDYVSKCIELEAYLRSNGYSIKGYFGNVNKNKAPDNYCIALSEFLRFNIVKNILSIATEYGFEYFSIFNPIEEPQPEEIDIFFGSYGSISGRITKEFIANIDNFHDMVDLLYYGKNSLKQKLGITPPKPQPPLRS